MDRFSDPSQTTNELGYMLTSFGCSAAPALICALLPEPWHTSLLPIAALFGAYAAMFALGLLFYSIERLWQLRPWRMRRAAVAALRCPACRSVEQPYAPFYVVRVGPYTLRVHCPECNERWFEHR
jgi:hypothetical protein